MNLCLPRACGVLVGLALGLGSGPLLAKSESTFLASPAESSGVDARSILWLTPPSRDRVRIPAAKFVMGATPLEMAAALDLCRTELSAPRCSEPALTALVRAEGHAHEVSLSSFEIDRTETTVAAYDRCVSAGACSEPGFFRADLRFAGPTLPITHVRHEDAQQFCRYVGGRLPTEAEWEFAARGAGRRTFPWGMLWNPKRCNHGSFADDERDAQDGFLNLAPVASYRSGATPTGLHDMAGNVAEWVADYYDRDEQGFGYPDAPAKNPPGPPGGILHPVRGGSFADGAMWQRTSARGIPQALRAANVGFRCAYDVARDVSATRVP